MNKPNKLINEKSPYLLQHAYNPVNWFPWCKEAFEEAESNGKPIFLSIGYSTCHWCHVMEKESFEDNTVAKLMNDNFVSIKVDREERPDIDGIYMSVCQMMTGSGGWPLTIIMTPQKKPFFAGTYFPKNNRFQRIGMIELLPKIMDVWENKRNEILQSANEIAEHLNKENSKVEKTIIDKSIFDKAYLELLNRFDSESGGFGAAPKFPSPHNLMFLLRYWKRNDEPKALQMVEKTLTEMRKGGIYDQVGFGFARYSTDKHWLVPHFEKMLYDQAMLVMAFTETYLATKNPFYKKAAEEIIEYVLRDMTHSEGGFYSAEDADSEGEEGKFYLWHADEVRSVLGKDELDLATAYYNIQDNGNWIDETKGNKNGTNIFHLKQSYEQLASKFNYSESEFEIKIETIRKKLFDYRKKKKHPYKDDKILTDWNGLMISALAKAAQAFDNKIYAEASLKAFSFIEKYLTDSNGRLLHRFRGGESGLPAHIDDYTFMINSAIDLYETTFEIGYIKKAIKWNQILLEEFWDETNGGFYFTSSKSEKLIARQKEIYDGAIPSGNSIALLNLVRLTRFTGNTLYDEKSLKIIECFSNNLLKSPSVFTQFLSGLDFYLGPSFEIVISSDKKDGITGEAIKLIRSNFHSAKIVMLNLQSESDELIKVIPYQQNLKMLNAKTTFYICQNFVCNKPAHTIEELKKLLHN